MPNHIAISIHAFSFKKQTNSISIHVFPSFFLSFSGLSISAAAPVIYRNTFDFTPFSIGRVFFVLRFIFYQFAALLLFTWPCTTCAFWHLFHLPKNISIFHSFASNRARTCKFKFINRASGARRALPSNARYIFCLFLPV